MFKRFDFQEWTFSDYLIWLSGLSVFIFILIKSNTLQVTCDEAYTLSQLPPQTIWELVSYKDSYTNNHILNSLLIKGLYAVFGKNLFIGRLPNILSFIVYFYFVYRFAKQFIEGNTLQLTFCLLMIGNVYLIDFFALARGYGLSVGLIMSSVYFAADYIFNHNKKNYPLSYALAILSVYAQFASLHYFLGLNLLFLLFHLKEYWESRDFFIFFKQIAYQILANATLALLIYLPIKAILRDNQIAYYGIKGFWDDTILSLIKNSLYSAGYFSEKTIPIFSILIGLAFLFSLIAVCQRLIFNRHIGTPSVFSLLIFLCTAASIILQFYLLKNQYPIDRTALFISPLIGLNLITAVAFLKNINKKIGHILAVILIIFSIYHFIRSSKTMSCREWWYDVHTIEVLNILKDIYQKEQRDTPLSIQTSSNMNPSFSFHQEVDKYDCIKPIFFVGQPDTVTRYDYYFIFSDDYPVLKNQYEIYKEFDWKTQYLLKRKEVLKK